MDQKLSKYLNKIDHYLKPLNAAERADIVKEIESEIFELSYEGKSADEIIERLGDEKELARAYIGNSITKGKFSLRKVGALIAFWLMSGVSGLFILPFTVISAGAFMISGIMIPIAGIVKFVAHLNGVELTEIGINFDNFTVGAVEFLPLSFIIGALTFGVGILAWKLTVFVVKTIVKSRKTVKSL